MAVVTVTARSVRPLPGAVVREFTAGGAGNVGDLVYIDASGNVQQAAGGAAGTARARGIVVSAGALGKTTFAIGDRLSVVIFGPVTGFAAMTPGNIHYVSNTAGALDTAAGTVSQVIGWAESATIFNILSQLA